MGADAHLPRGRLALPLAVRGGARVARVAGAPLVAAVMVRDVVGAPALASKLLVCVAANWSWRAIDRPCEGFDTIVLYGAHHHEVRRQSRGVSRERPHSR